MGIWNKFKDYSKVAVAELQNAAGVPDPRSVDHRVSTVRSQHVEKHSVDIKKLERFWDLYKNVPLIRQPIRSFASEVVGPGYYIETDNEELREELEEWLAHSAIVDGEIDKDFRNLLKKATIQREVKGTAVIEIVKSEDGDFYGFKLMRPETVKAYTYPGQSVLLPPDAEVETSDLFRNDKIYRDNDGDVAAYIQRKQDLIPGRGSDSVVPFARDRIIKLTRDPDVGEVFGTSRLEAVEGRVESLLKKLEDNDKAIESLAHPFQLIQFGDGEDIWEPSEIKAFMNAHEQEDFEPGMKQGVQGNVSVETVSGEVAPIGEFLNFDVNWIISEMPLPKYALGGFEEDVNQFVSRSQETRIEKQIKEARQEIEDEWNPVIEKKAEELGYDSDDVELKISEDPSTLGLAAEGDVPGENQGASGTDFTRPPASTEPEREEDNQEQGSGDTNGD